MDPGAADMLWAGVPVVSAPGAAQPARVAAALLLAAGRGAFLARSLADLPAAAAAALARAPACGAPRAALFEPAWFAVRLARALRLAAQAPDHHIVAPEARAPHA